jgi:hypothetical protein
MARYEKRQPAEEATHTAGHCRVCGSVHEFRCATPGCDRPGTITASTNHTCAGQVRWFCAKHFHDR